MRMYSAHSLGSLFQRAVDLSLEAVKGCELKSKVGEYSLPYGRRFGHAIADSMKVNRSMLENTRARLYVRYVTHVHLADNTFHDLDWAGTASYH